MKDKSLRPTFQQSFASSAFAFLYRLVEFVRRYGISVQLAYSPPYHSKYNPIERYWGILEHHWNGALLDTIEAVVNYTASMTWKGIHPVVEVVTTIYRTGVRLSQDAMAGLEAQIQRLPGLDKWFVDITPSALWDASLFLSPLGGEVSLSTTRTLNEPTVKADC